MRLQHWLQDKWGKSETKLEFLELITNSQHLLCSKKAFCSCFDSLMQMKYEMGKNNKILGKPFHFVETPTHRIGKEKTIHHFLTLYYKFLVVRFFYSGKQNFSEIYISMCMYMHSYHTTTICRSVRES